MVLLDSDHMTLLQRGGEPGERIKQRLGHLAPGEVATTIVNYEEQMRLPLRLELAEMRHPNV